MSKLLILLFISFLSINCKLEEQKDLQLYLSNISTDKVGKKGTVIVSFEQREEYIEFKNTRKEECFNSEIFDGTNNFVVNCGLWNSEDNSYEILVFCNIEENIPSGNYTLLLDEVQSFYYRDYNVTLNAEGGQETLKFQKVDKDIIDLYSDIQTITIQNEVDSYELKFNIVSYNQEKLFFSYFLILECKTENNILKCPLTKKDLLAYIKKESSKNEISYLDTSNYNQNKLLLIPRVQVIVKDIQKKDIFVGIKKLLVNANEHDVPIAYETNVTDISNFYLFSDGFSLTFINKNSEGIESENDGECNFLKYDNNPLLLVCWLNGESENRLKEIKEEIIINNLNVLYNYRIQPVKNEEIIYYKGTGSFIMWYYPKILDFTKNSGNLSIIYSIEEPNYLNGFTYNEDEKDLNCEIIGRHIKKCEVTKEHFNGKKDGLYFVKHTNHLGQKSISYEVQPINVIISTELILVQGSVEEGTVGKKGTIVTSFRQEDTSYKIIDTQKKTCFESKVSNGKDNYNVNCGLWSKDEYDIFIFCDIDENIPSGNYSILFKETEPFYYNNYKVTLKVSEGDKNVEFQKVDKDIIDLYSDAQTLIIDNNVDNYELKFNIVSYNQEKIFFNYNMILDNCRNENKILNCPLTKKDLLSYIPSENIRGDISYLNYQNYQRRFPLIVPIKIEIKNIQKIDIFVGITKLLVDTNEHDVPIAYETNVTNISNFYSFLEEFSLTFINKNGEGIESENEGECSFLKYENNPLLLVCFVNEKYENRLKEITEEIIIGNNSIVFNIIIEFKKLEMRK